MTRARLELEDDDDELSPSRFPEHPLFPLEKGERVPDISFIQVTRRQDGGMVWGPVVVSSDLTSTDQIVERWGGGFYELVGRQMSKNYPGQPGNFSKRRTYTLPGQEKPFSDRPTLRERMASGLAPEVGSAPAGNPQAAGLPAASSGGGLGDSTVLLALLNMQQQSAARSEQMMVTFMTMFMKMIEQGKADAQNQQNSMITMMTTLSSGQQNSMMQLLPLLIQNRGGGPEEVAKYAQLFKALGGAANGEAKPEKEDPGVGGILESLADIVAGAPAAVASLQGLKGAQMPTMPDLAPNGSAASVLGGIG